MYVVTLWRYCDVVTLWRYCDVVTLWRYCDVVTLWRYCDVVTLWRCDTVAYFTYLCFLYMVSLHTLAHVHWKFLHKPAAFAEGAYIYDDFFAILCHNYPGYNHSAQLHYTICPEITHAHLETRLFIVVGNTTLDPLLTRSLHGLVKGH